LNDRHVKYLVVGGYAVSFHAQPRGTKDLDVFVSPDLKNAKALFAALADFGAPLANFSPQDFTEPNFFFRMGRSPSLIDILPAISGVSFEAAWKRRAEVEIDAESGLKAFVISSTDLVANKLALARPHDLADVAALRQARTARRKPRSKRATSAKKRR
jgi:hypothetical protein